MLQVVRVPNPPAGQDWLYTIPGQWTARLLGVTASLTTATNPPTAIDSSPNAHDATYQTPGTHVTYGVTGPFGGGGGFAVAETGVLPPASIALLTNNGAFDVATFTSEALVNINPAVPFGFQVLLGIRQQSGGFLIRELFGVLNQTPTSVIRIAASSGDVFNLASTITNSAWHHVAATYDGAQWVGYVDGVAGAATVGHPPSLGVTLAGVAIGGDNQSGQVIHGQMAAAAYFSGVLSGAQIAAHAAAVATSAAAYKAAVLADSPVALWMLDEVVTHASRKVALVIQDGTFTVGYFPADFAGTGAGTYTWSWEPLGSGAIQTTDGSVSTVPIPDMTLPAGYGIGSSTPDMSPLDQWSNITVWFDDGTGAGAHGGYSPAPYLNALLVPDWWKG